MKDMNRKIHIFITNLFLKKYKRKLVIKNEVERLFGKNFKILNPKHLNTK